MSLFYNNLPSRACRQSLYILQQTEGKGKNCWHKISSSLTSSSSILSSLPPSSSSSSSSSSSLSGRWSEACGHHRIHFSFWRNSLSKAAQRRGKKKLNCSFDHNSDHHSLRVIVLIMSLWFLSCDQKDFDVVILWCIFDHMIKILIIRIIIWSTFWWSG